jgi:predicted Fe-Mo cluster-binding NifX family protein
MKLAVPTKDQMVDSHFGHCDHYTIFTIDESKSVQKTEDYESPQGCGCKSDVAILLKAEGVDVMLAGNMGQGAVNKVQEAGIKVIRGCVGNINDVVKQYLSGFIMDSGEVCSHVHGEEGHECNH